MTKDARSLLAQAMRLSVRDRADLVAELLASLDGDVDPEVETAWAMEIERRARLSLTGKGDAADWTAFRRGFDSGKTE